jgi:hypothetical protein
MDWLKQYKYLTESITEQMSVLSLQVEFKPANELTDLENTCRKLMKLNVFINSLNEK